MPQAIRQQLTCTVDDTRQRGIWLIIIVVMIALTGVPCLKMIDSAGPLPTHGGSPSDASVMVGSAPAAAPQLPVEHPACVIHSATCQVLLTTAWYGIALLCLAFSCATPVGLPPQWILAPLPPPPQP